MDIDYYKNLFKIKDKKLKSNIVNSLNDIVNNNDIFIENENEPILKLALMNNISNYTIRNSFKNCLNFGQENLSKYNLSINLTNEINNSIMDFKVDPETLPQSNIHMLIGRNGVGKTYLFSNIIDYITNNKKTSLISKIDGVNNIASIIAISYSVFDTTLPKKSITDKKVPYKFIGLSSEELLNSQNSNIELDKYINSEFFRSFEEIKKQESLSNLAKRSLESLNSDPLFRSIEISKWLNQNDEGIKKLYNHLSSGHRIVLLSLFKMIVAVEPNSLILIDEPEMNLHPPLISSFIQAILVFLKEKNAMSIIATHSPVALQEATKDSTWIIKRKNNKIRINRPTIETFGENVGILTHEVFDLEADNSGYMKIIKTVVNNSNSLDEVKKRFNNKLGQEALMVAASLISQKEIDNEN